MKYRCGICGQEFRGYSHNMSPLVGEEGCCSECNSHVIIPLRTIVSGVVKGGVLFEAARYFVPLKIRLLFCKTAFSIERLQRYVGNNIGLVKSEDQPHATDYFKFLEKSFLFLYDKDGFEKKLPLNEGARRNFGVIVYGPLLMVKDINLEEDAKCLQQND